MAFIVPCVLLLGLAPWCVAQDTRRERRERRDGFLPHTGAQTLQPDRTVKGGSDAHHQETNSVAASMSSMLSMQARGMLKEAKKAVEMPQQRLRTKQDSSMAAVVRSSSAVPANMQSSAKLFNPRAGDVLGNRFALVEVLSFSRKSHSSVVEGQDSSSSTDGTQDDSVPNSLAQRSDEDLPRGIPEKYQIPNENFLGSGSFGEAWLAKDKTSGNDVVVKLFKETGDYVSGIDKTAFDERDSTGIFSTSDDEDHSANEDGDQHPLVTHKMSRHIGDMKHECDIAKDVENRAITVDETWSRYQDRLMKCLDMNVETAGTPIFVALSYGGKASVIHHIEDKLDQWHHENNDASIVEYQEHIGKSCERYKAIESESLHDALEQCSDEIRCIGIVADAKAHDNLGAEEGSKPFLMCFHSESSFASPSSFTQADSTSSTYEQHRGARAISLRKKVLVADLFGQLLEGLSLLEELGISHHDVKVNNAVVDENGLVHLIDYGAMSYWGDTCSSVHTWDLAPPEFMQGSSKEKKICDRHFDVWSAANVLLQMIQKSGLGKHKTHRDPVLDLFCDADHLECTGEHRSGRSGSTSFKPTKAMKEGWKEARQEAYSEMEQARKQGILTDSRVKDTVDEVFLQDPQFKSFIEEYFSAAMDPIKENRPSFQDVLTSREWFAPLRRKPGSGGKPLKVVSSIPYSGEDT